MGKVALKPPTDSQEEENKHSFLKNARDIGFVVAVFLYLMGWVYVYYYLRDFGISIRQVDIDFYNLITYSIDVIMYIMSNAIEIIKSYFTWILVISVVLLVIGIFMYRIYRGKMVEKLKWLSEGKFNIWLKYSGLLLALVLAYTVAAKAAFNNRDRDQLKHESKLHTIRFEFKEEKANVETVGLKVTCVNKDNTKKAGVRLQAGKTNKDSLKTAPNLRAELALYSKNGELRLLIADKETYYVFRFDPTVTRRDVGAPIYEIYAVQREDLKYVKITN